MREIKFRAWDIELLKISNPFKIGNILQFENTFKSYNESIHILMQFTGSTQKCIDIYEDDILIIANDEAYSPIPPDFKGVVKLIEGCWYVDSDKAAFLVWQEIAQWEVIGNIHQNPELLK